jgi:flagellar motor protein MotB
MKKKHPEHVNLERWLVSYADFITLLFAFFVIMYAISQADVSKFKKVSASIKAAFEAAGPAGMIDVGGNAGGSTANPFDTMETAQGRIINMPAGKSNTASDPDPQLQSMKEPRTRDSPGREGFLRAGQCGSSHGHAADSRSDRKGRRQHQSTRSHRRAHRCFGSEDGNVSVRLGALCSPRGVGGAVLGEAV